MKTNLLEQEKIRLMPWLGLRCQSQKENIPRRRVGRTKITREAYLSSVSNSMCRNKWVKVSQSCPTLPPHGILQARILEWVAFPFSRGSSQPRDWTQFSHIVGRFFTSWATREAWAKIKPVTKPKGQELDTNRKKRKKNYKTQNIFRYSKKSLSLSSSDMVDPTSPS